MSKPTKTESNDFWVTLHGGYINSVARQGDVVRRELSTASHAIHQLLRHLEIHNVNAVPRILKVDATREFLTFLPGNSVLRPWVKEVKTDAWLVQLGQWLRDYHTKIRGFRLEDGVVFSWGPKTPDDDMIVCHGDLGPWNCI
jgi:Phosphotransferase enzyme family